MKRNDICSFWVLLIAFLFLLAGCHGGGGGGGGFFLPSKKQPQPPSTSAPGSFNLISPANNDTASPNPAFSWTAASGAESYTVQVDSETNPAFTTAVINQTVQAPKLSLVPGTTLTDGTKYIWRVIATNSVGSTASTEAYNKFTARNSGGVQWAALSPAGTSAEAFAVATDGTYLYAVGYDDTPGNDQWRIEKRNVSDGSLVSGFGSDGAETYNPSGDFDDPYGIVIDSNNSYMYVVGNDSGGAGGKERWRIEKRSLSDGQLTGFGVAYSTPTGTHNTAWAVTKDSNNLYIVGFETDESGYEEWRIESRNLTTGATNTIITSDFNTPGGNEAYAIAVDNSSMYVGGYDSTAGLKWLIEKRALSGELDTGGFGSSGILSIPVNGAVTALATSQSGTLYVVGYEQVGSGYQWRIEKRDSISGDLLTSFGGVGYVTSHPSSLIQGDDEPNAIVIDEANNAMYVAGFESVSADDFAWRVEKRSLDTGGLVASFGDGGAITQNLSTASGASDDDIWGIAADSGSIYLAGYDSMPGSPEWRIEKRTK